MDTSGGGKGVRGDIFGMLNQGVLEIAFIMQHGMMA